MALSDDLKNKDIANGAGQRLKNTSKKDEKSTDQDSLKRLGSHLNDNGDRNKNDRDVGGIVKRILIILLVIVLLAGIGIAIYFFTKNPNNITQAGIINLSTKVSENLENVSPNTPSISNTEIYPGHKFSVNCMVRNSENIDGDNNLSEYDNVFIRYSIVLEIDGKTYNNVIVPIITKLAEENWHNYLNNPDEEVSDYVWDGYYYYYGSLAKNQSLTLFEEIQFDFHNTLNEFGGKSARIIINVEAVHASVDNLGVDAGNAWSTAPRRWINNMQKGVNNNGSAIEI